MQSSLITYLALAATVTALSPPELLESPILHARVRGRSLLNHKVAEIISPNNARNVARLIPAEKREPATTPAAVVRADAESSAKAPESVQAGSPQSPGAPGSSAMPPLTSAGALGSSPSAAPAPAPPAAPESSSPATSLGVVAPGSPASALPQTTNVNAGIAVGVIIMGTGTYTLATLPDGNLAFGDTRTILANSAPAMVDGQAVSFGTNGLVIAGSSTFPITAAAPATSAVPPPLAPNGPGANNATVSVPAPLSVTAGSGSGSGAGAGAGAGASAGASAGTATGAGAGTGAGAAAGPGVGSAAGASTGAGPLTTTSVASGKAFSQLGKGANAAAMANDANKDEWSETVVGVIVGVIAMLLI